MKMYTGALLAALLCCASFGAEAIVEKPQIIEKVKPEIDAEKVLNDFLLEYDQGTINRDMKGALRKNAASKSINTALPPRTPDLFASGLFMPYEDNHGMYHEFDRIYFKIKDGSWNLSGKKGDMESGIGGFVFTKESGVEVAGAVR